ncbi:MAG: hypothetical protein KAV83_01520 [Desulfobacterales bacterium]|nr:hypothetical protein [Desulfobacterales bacterium]
MIRSYMDYAQKAHIYFQTPPLRSEAFDFLEGRLRELVLKKKADGGASLLSNLKRFLENRPSLSIRRVDEGLRQEAEDFFIRNIDSLLKLSALAGDPWERFHTLYLIARFLPQLEEKKVGIKSSHLIQGYLLFIHTLSHPELYLKDVDGKEDKACFVLAAKGLYRWDGKGILQKWNTAPDLLKSITGGIASDAKRPYEPIMHHAKRICETLIDEKKQNEEDLLFMFFTSGILSAVRLRLLKEKKKDLLYEIWTKKQEEILESLRGYHMLLFSDEPSVLGALEAFVSSRLGEAWFYEDPDFRSGVRRTEAVSSHQDFFQSSMSSGKESFPEEDLAIIRRLSRTGPSSS